MKRYMPWVVMPFLTLLGCDSDDSNPSDTTGGDTTDTTGGDTVPDTVTPGVSALTGVNTNVTVTEPTPNAGCAASEVDNGDHGASYPWGGLTAAGTSYTCNKCPSGLQDFQGMFRAHGFAADETTPDYDKGADASSDDAELLYIDGNTFYFKLYDKQTNTTDEARGWFFCSQKPENNGEHLFWVVTDGIQGAPQDGDINRTDVILSQGADRKLISYFDELTGQTNVQIGYCKIGTSSGGKTCNNPFE